MMQNRKELRPIGSKLKPTKAGKPISYSDHITFEELVSEIQMLVSSKSNTVVVAISGFGGAGKTTLAEKLKNRFHGSTWIQLDNFIVNRTKGDDWDSGYDWSRLERVLRDVRADKELHYQFYDWHKDALTGWIDVSPLPKLIIVEGIRLLQPKFMTYFDLSVWIDCPIEVAAKRGIERDRKNGVDNQHILEWEKNWIPKDKTFYEMYRPDESASFLVESHITD
ncbi:MAG TPA: AAA family ATPase [Candidatus Saccharimonadales bacterium]|nr:AAA family ATPase [Candidatus Saccharimonadales bacterium]